MSVFWLELIWANADATSGDICVVDGPPSVLSIVGTVIAAIVW